MVTQERKTPYITDDQDTVQLIKYYLHNKVKHNVLTEFSYDECHSFAKFNDHIRAIPLSKSRLQLI